MATKRLSPAANLLRHSKLFSLPPQIPLHASNQSSQVVSQGSDTATLPHPTHAAIETSHLTIRTGDWGLKRPLPLKTTTETSTPVIRVSAIDSIDHITYYESAADHTLTLRKWQEMNIPVSANPPESRFSPRRYMSPNEKFDSVFEESLQATTKEEEHIGSESQRWKFDGPWLAGLTAGEFEMYLKTELRKRQPYFNSFARKWLAKRKAAIMKSEALAKGEVTQDNAAVELTDAEYQSSIARLRKEKFDLWALVWEFLDLPGRPPLSSSSMGSKLDREVTRLIAEVDQGPPATHPSAGLSYLRTNAHIDNHPQLGPVRMRPPIEGRILQHANPSGRVQKEMLIGVGGVVATREDNTGRMSDGYNSQEVRFDPDLEGGAKIWVQPKKAHVDSRGRIQLVLDKAGSDDLAVWEHKVDGRDAGAIPQGNPKMSLDSRRKSYNRLFKGAA